MSALIPDAVMAEMTEIFANVFIPRQPNWRWSDDKVAQIEPVVTELSPAAEVLLSMGLCPQCGGRIREIKWVLARNGFKYLAHYCTGCQYTVDTPRSESE